MTLDSKAATKRCTIGVSGLDCADCARKLEEAVSRLAGVEKVNVNLFESTLSAEGTDPSFDRKRIADEIERLGYTPLPESPQKPSEESAAASAAHAIKALLPVALTILAAALQFASLPPLVFIPAYIVAIVVGARDFAIKGISATLRLSLDMNTLMTLAVIGAMVLGDWLEAATVVILFALANHLEARSMERARRAIRSLMELAPQTALVERDGDELEMPVSEVQVGEIVIVRPGARVPLDGVVVGGASSVDQSAVTGESLPTAVEEGSELFAGSINGDGVLRVEVTSGESDSTLARIIALVREAQQARSPRERLVDRFAKVYTPVVVLIALLIALLPPLFLGGWDVWFYRALVMLVIACPCALVISTPVGIVSGLTAAARAGVLIKGGEHLERAAAVDLVAFDKTGTLTAGKPSVESVFGFDGHSEEEVLRIAASLERHSEHLLARAITAEARRRSLALDKPDNLRSLPGLGVEGLINGHTARAGSHRMFADLGLCCRGDDCPVKAHDLDGRTLVCVSREGEMIGAIALRDTIREQAAPALAELHRLGIREAVLTGDNRPAAQAVASELGIDHVEASLMPSGKLERLRRWREEGRTVMMVGDGVNDAPALAAADVGVAMGAAGTDVAIETADIALMADDLGNLPWTIAHSRRTMRVIGQNIFLSIAVKLLFLAMAASGLATLWMAIAADMGVSLAVIGNSLRLLSGRPKRLTQTTDSI